MNLYTSQLTAIKAIKELRQRLQGFTKPIIAESILTFCLPETISMTIAGIVQFAVCGGYRCSFC